ncbi:DNA translocase FtsK [Candidatus Woesebacteria bacterium]|nr:DNA translocase FtsK [Candidatus Woesebacteria bacterium]
MGRRRKSSPIKLQIRQDLAYSIASLVFFAFAGLTMFAFRGEGHVFSVVNSLLRGWFGGTSLLVPFLFFSAGLMLTRIKWAFAKPHVFLGAMILFLGSTSLFSEGALGILVFEWLADTISATGASFVSLLVIIAGFLIMTDTGLNDIIHFVGSVFEVVPSKPVLNVKPVKGMEEEEEESKDDAKADLFADTKIQVLDNPVPAHSAPQLKVATPAMDPEKKIELLKKVEEVTASKAQPAKKEPDEQKFQVWTLPPVSLLDPKSGGQANRGDVRSNAEVIEKTLDSFGITARIVEVNRGPAVTQFGLQIGTGTKLSKITGLANDLALALAAPTGQIRIEAPIPGKSLVGVEIPNISSEFVTLRTMLLSEQMKKVPSKLAVALGLDVSGKPVVIDIGKMPHCLIAGATGSGKSVCMNAFIASILFRATPEEVKFIMVDPKRVELTQYNDIPHLLTPVITDTQKVLGTLQWAVNEMNNRYKLFAEVGVRNISAYNEMAGFQAMPYIVIVIDELADIMLLSPAPVEEAITRIAQMARAVGIHLILATQRPSVNVITGLIKANVPTRIAFNVSSMIDSRVILDSPGAEKLLGRGDMLYIPPDQAKPTRVQGTFVGDHEISRLIEFIRQQGRQPSYVHEIQEKFQTVVPTSAGGSKEGGTGDKDEQLMVDAIRVMLQYNKASVSVLQRRLSLGYGRAARIMDMLAEEGVVGDDQGSKGREINVTRAQEFVAQREANA